MREFITKGEISQLLGIAKSQVRFYEKKGLLRPKIGENGYAEYRFKDIYDLDVILFLRELDTSIEEISDLVLHDEGYDYLDILKKADKQIEEEIKQLKKKRKNINRRMTVYEESSIDKFIIKHMKKRNIYVSTEDFSYVHAKRAYDLTQKFSIDYRDFSNELCHMRKNGATVTGLINDDISLNHVDLEKQTLAEGDYLSYTFYFDQQAELAKHKERFREYVDASPHNFDNTELIIDHFGKTYYNMGNFVITMQRRIIAFHKG